MRCASVSIGIGSRREGDVGVVEVDYLVVGKAVSLGHGVGAELAHSEAVAPAAADESDAVAIFAYLKGDALQAQRRGAEFIAGLPAEAGAAAVGVRELHADDVAGVGVSDLDAVRRCDGETKGIRLFSQLAACQGVGPAAVGVYARGSSLKAVHLAAQIAHGVACDVLAVLRRAAVGGAVHG